MRYASKTKGTILIAALWMVAILTVFAISVGRQSAISLKITSYNTDQLKAYFIARAGMLRALAQKQLEHDSELLSDIDALSEGWANNKDLFDHKSFGSGSYTLSYYLDEDDLSEGERPVLYGLMDEQSKININFAPKETIANLLTHLEVDENEAQEIAAAIVDWRDEDGTVTFSEDENFLGAEDAYYQGASPPYHCKNFLFDNIYELYLVRGVTSDMFTLLKEYITVYGEGKVNINTAGETVLNALMGPDFPNLASKIVKYRRGNDDTSGTEDDRWFCIGPYVIDRQDKGFVEIKNLQDAEWYANIYGIINEEYNRIREHVGGGNPQICVSSKAFRVKASGEVDMVKSSIESVWLFDEKGIPPKIAYWYQE
ncbi:MAG: hypothetical protein ABH843_02450 [Candidatus Omnitrophota bacterium]